MKKFSGKFITFEGIDGSGKSTQIRLLEQYLRAREKNVFVSREPGGTGLKFAEAIRRLILHPRYKIHPRSELLLYEASRAQHVEKRILPMIRKGYWVLCDRFTDATLAYQGGGRCIPIQDLLWLNRFATNNVRPDLTILLDIPVRIGLKKARRLSKIKNKKGIFVNGDRLEREKIGFHKRVQSFYRKMAREHERIHTIKVADTAKETHRKIVQVIQKKWPYLKKIKI